MKIEVKSITSGKRIRLSSIKGWSEDQLPKALVVVICKTQRAEAIPRADGTKTKKRDIEVRIEDLRLFYFGGEDADLFVPWPGEPTFEQVTGTKWRDQPKLLEQIKKIAREANLASTAPVKLQAEKNGPNCRIHYVCPDINKLPAPPKEIAETLLERFAPLKGALLRLWKDHSAHGYIADYLTQEMVHWEDRHRMKSTGRLEVDLRDGRRLSFPEFRSGRQDYWGGFAIEAVVERLNHDVMRTTSGTIGADLTLQKLMQRDEPTPVDTTKLKQEARKVGKHTILREIQASLHIRQKPSDVSKGSTVTRGALRLITYRIAARKGRLPLNTDTKSSCIHSALVLLGQPTDEDDVSKGGTVTAYALLKILQGLRNNV